MVKVLRAVHILASEEDKKLKTAKIFVKYDDEHNDDNDNDGDDDKRQTLRCIRRSWIRQREN